jgi:hypothetical protein
MCADKCPYNSGATRIRLLPPCSILGLLNCGKAAVGSRWLEQASSGHGCKLSSRAFVLSDDDEGNGPWRPIRATGTFIHLCNEADISGVSCTTYGTSPPRGSWLPEYP